MKKIDLHIHTIATPSDSYFEFSLESFKRYVTEARLDAVAVTNHDLFDLSQYHEIAAALPCVVLPGIEINVEQGHLLVFASPDDADDFSAKAKVVNERVAESGRISVEEFRRIYGGLERYLLITHYEKDPPLSQAAIELLRPHVSAGEVDSAKKFVRCWKDPSKLSPVLFSDCRVRVGMTSLPTRHTFVDCGDITIGALRESLRHKDKVALSEKDGNRLWQALENGQQFSTGLNVLIGARSSGKTHTLDVFHESNENVKYIKQFSLVQQDEAEYEKKFSQNVERSRSSIADAYLHGLKKIVDDLMTVEPQIDEKSVDGYVSSLLKSAEEIDRRDTFSNSALFNESDFSIGNLTRLETLIASVKHLIENIEYREQIEKHVQLSSLRALIVDLILEFRRSEVENRKRAFVNSIVKEVRGNLRRMTSSTAVDDVDLYEVALNTRRVKRFNEIVTMLKTEKVIHTEEVQGFRVEVKRRAFTNAQEVKNTSGVKTSFVEAFKKYGTPFAYFKELRSNEALTRSELYKLFSRIEYRILNRDGFEVSGGERSEFRLLQEISDAHRFDVLLIDEPESSFDNIFLKSDVNTILRQIAQQMPVVVVTHNNTVGASVKADFVLFSAKENGGSASVYRIYSGYPTDRVLRSIDGKSIETHRVFMDALEAGSDAYEERRNVYEASKGK